MLQVELTITQSVVVTMEVKDDQGVAAVIVGVPAWRSDEPTHLTLTPAGATCTVTATTTLGNYTVHCSAVATIGGVSVQVHGSFGVSVIPAKARDMYFSAAIPA